MKRQTICCLLLIVFSRFFAFGYGFVYRLEPVTDTLLITGSIASTMTGFWLYKRSNPVATAEITALDSHDVNRFDRIVCGVWNPPFSLASDVTSVLTFTAPLLFYLNQQVQKNWLTFR